MKLILFLIAYIIRYINCIKNYWFKFRIQSIVMFIYLSQVLLICI